MGDTEMTCGSMQGGVIEVAAAMLHMVLAHRPPYLCLQSGRDSGQAWLRFTYPTSATWATDGAGTLAADLVLIDSLATHWRHSGDSQWHILWATVPDEGGRNRDDQTAACGGRVDDLGGWMARS